MTEDDCGYKKTVIVLSAFKVLSTGEGRRMFICIQNLIACP